MNQTLKNKNILLIISGGIAAYKSLMLIRLIKKAGGRVRCLLTKGGSKFITPLSVAALSEEHVYTDLWSLEDETEMGHIRLSREADLIVVAPTSANLMAQMTHGLADDLASTVILASNKPILLAPAMNVRMWDNAATQENLARLKKRDIQTIGPAQGSMACGEYGMGRMVEPEHIFENIVAILGRAKNAELSGLKALVTAGPTCEAIDPVRFISNRSSGKQGYAIAQALARAGADVTLVSGPVSLSKEYIPAAENVTLTHVETAGEMLGACESALPVDIAVCTAAVSDWAPETRHDQKVKKQKNQKPAAISLTETPDILHNISHHKNRPKLVIGFAAETENLLKNAQDKLKRKECDWILANDVGAKNVFGHDKNHVYFLDKVNTQDWGERLKTEVAQMLVEHIVQYFSQNTKS